MKQTAFYIFIGCVLLGTANLPAKPYRGAELRTIDSYTYGRFEVRYKAAAGAGQTSTFFTYYDGPNAFENWNELDIEILGRYPDDVQFNAITPNQTNHVSHQFVGFNPYTNYHTYAIEWTPDYVAWFADGVEMYRQTEDHVSTLTHPQKIMMNIWPPVYEDWAGKLNPGMLPVFAYYDWVQYASYTPGSGDMGSGNNFSLQWRDDFDHWDQNRWSKGSHTWVGNNSQFTPDNCVFREGNMILCLTDSVHTGYTDNSPPKVDWIHAENNKVLIQYTEQVDSVSAVQPANYTIPGQSIAGISLLSDRKTVRILLADSMRAGNGYNVIIFNVKDLPPGGNTLLGANVSFTATSPLIFPVRINVGGNATGQFAGDSLWNPSGNYGYENGSRQTISQGWDIGNTTDDQAYRDFIKDIATYRVRVPNGVYSVNLLFSENEFTQAGKRVFDVQVENQTVVDNLDIFQVAGAKSAYTISAAHIPVNDERLDIHFSDAHLNPPVLNGIEIMQESTGNATGFSAVPEGFQLFPNFPNPFNAATTIKYHLASSGDVSLKVLNLRGQLMQMLYSGKQDAGSHAFQWNAETFSSGIYMLQLATHNTQGSFHQSQKVVLLK